MGYSLHQMRCNTNSSNVTHRSFEFPTEVRGCGGWIEVNVREKNGAGKSGEDMDAELNLLEVWIPEQMQPGTIFMLEQAGELGKPENPYWAVLACPSCGAVGLITRQQWAGLEAMICGSPICSAEYLLQAGKIRFRPVC